MRPFFLQSEIIAPLKIKRAVFIIIMNKIFVYKMRISKKKFKFDWHPLYNCNLASVSFSQYQRQIGRIEIFQQ